MNYSLTLTGEAYEQLRTLLFPTTGNEHVALLRCGRSFAVDPWNGQREERFLCREVVHVAPGHIISATPVSVTYSTRAVLGLAKQVARQDGAVGLIHSHRSELAAFSKMDDASDVEALAVVFDRNEGTRPHFSLVMTETGRIVGRSYGPDLKEPESIGRIRVIGERWRFMDSSAPPVSAAFDRQVRVFGAAVTSELRKVRVGVVGCGGTGSATASLLARLGVGHLALFDPDIVEPSNLNRLYFSRQADADAGALKVDVVGRGVSELSLGVSVRTFPFYTEDPRCRDALKSCDVIFGCSDDNRGRSFLNRLAHFYLIPIIDLGVLIEPNQDRTSYDTFDGRVTVVQPGYACQVCRGLISSDRMRAEVLAREDPDHFERQRRAGYVPSLDEPSPVVATFTTECAAMAANELLQRLTGFRGESGVSERIRRFDAAKGTDVLAGGQKRPACPLCGRRQYDGRGDVEPFLDET